jgi:hypothetical protein
MYRKLADPAKRIAVIKAFVARLLKNALLCFDRALLSNVEGLSMNGRNSIDFKKATVRPEPVEGCFSVFARSSRTL